MKWITIIALLAVFLSQSQNTSSQLETVDFQKAKVVIQLDPFSNEVKGSVLFDLQILKNTSSIFLDAKNLVGHQVLIKGNKVKSIYDGEKLVIEAPFHTGDVLELTVKFTSYPSKAMYHIDKDKDRLWDQVWTQGQGKYTSNWLPSIDDMNDKMIWNLSITAPVSKRVIANGKLVTVTEGKETKTWNYTMEKPMSSYLVALAAGDYQVKRDSSASGIPLEFYYYDNQESKVAPTYQHSKEIFDFLEGEIGVAYPWQNYKQVPVKDFLYSGMENTGMTIFNDEFFTVRVRC